MLTALVILMVLLFTVNGFGLWAAMTGRLKLSDHLSTVWYVLLGLLFADVAAIVVRVVNSN